ncbi:uncharacterized protein BXZ73DRAFT_103684 [Epithele typhae]|uniref:uncharacterized protein n=1 Tax=Epithele typhae TaxID=378194 RepID=UPI00200745D9|nr:uncharacterized protein BXZ73DRAFT_103684 [Epithele typhae]KAH9923951.1 hypothetical protein BXZ73DRAFT_103684 [Epithele typhae]
MNRQQAQPQPPHRVPAQHPAAQHPKGPPQHRHPDELFFFGTNDPRQGDVLIGFRNDIPVLYRFDTMDLPTGTRTTVRFNEQLELALLNWTMGKHMGSLVRNFNRTAAARGCAPHRAASNATPMADYVARGSVPNGRQFRSRAVARNEVFEWRRLGLGPTGRPEHYELFAISPAGEDRIATFAPDVREIENQGRSYARLRYTFPDEEELLHDAVIALCLNRWIDWQIDWQGM